MYTVYVRYRKITYAYGAVKMQLHFADYGKFVRPSVCPFDCLSVCNVEVPDHIGWKSSKIILRSVNFGCSLSTDPNITDAFQREHPEISTQLVYTLLH